MKMTAYNVSVLGFQLTPNSAPPDRRPYSVKELCRGDDIVLAKKNFTQK